MLQTDTLQFLADLKANNSREWFEINKARYDAARKDYEAFAGALMKAMTPLEPRLAEQEARKTMFRIFRDVRFSKDKTPYKTHLSSYFSREGRKWEGAGYYLHVEPGQVFAAAGMWMPEGALLKAVRQEVDYSFDELQALLEAKPFKKHFGRLEGPMLQKVPAGYEADHPAAGYLKMKSFIGTCKLTDEVLLQPDAVKKVAAAFTAAGPLVAFLNRAFD